MVGYYAREKEKSVVVGAGNNCFESTVLAPKTMVGVKSSALQYCRSITLMPRAKKRLLTYMFNGVYVGASVLLYSQALSFDIIVGVRWRSVLMFPAPFVFSVSFLLVLCFFGRAYESTVRLYNSGIAIDNGCCWKNFAPYTVELYYCCRDPRRRRNTGASTAIQYNLICGSWNKF